MKFVDRGDALDLSAAGLPILLTVPETAELLRTTPKAIYAMVERGLLPGVVRPLPRRVLVQRDALVRWLRESCAPSPRR